MSCVSSVGGETDESDSLNRRFELSPSIETESLYSGEAVTLISLVYSLSTHRLQGDLFIDLSLFSAFTSVPSFSPSLFSLSFLPSNGLIFLELCCYYPLCIFEVQITLSKIINFSKSDTFVCFISMCAQKYNLLIFGISSEE